MQGKSLECLALFRNLMVEVIVSSSYGYRLGAVGKWAHQAEDPLSVAISDFPKRGILVRSPITCCFLHNAYLCWQRSVVPTWAWKLICRIPNARWRQLCDSDKIMAEVGSPIALFLRFQKLIAFLPSLSASVSIKRALR